LRRVGVEKVGDEGYQRHRAAPDVGPFPTIGTMGDEVGTAVQPIQKSEAVKSIVPAVAGERRCSTSIALHREALRVKKRVLSWSIAAVVSVPMTMPLIAVANAEPTCCGAYLAKSVRTYTIAGN